MALKNLISIDLDKSNRFHNDVYAEGSCHCDICEKWLIAKNTWLENPCKKHRVEYLAWDNLRDLFSEISYWAFAEEWMDSGWDLWFYHTVNTMKKTYGWWFIRGAQLPVDHWIEMIDQAGLSNKKSGGTQGREEESN